MNAVAAVALPSASETQFDWKSPKYEAILEQRVRQLSRLRAHPELLPRLREYYRDNPADFINDWGMTFDPRQAERGLPTIFPMVLWPKQREWINWIVGLWRQGKPGLTEKSRDSGVSWLSVMLAGTLCLFHDGVVIGFGSRKETYVDTLDDPTSLFFKARMFLSNLPKEFLGSFSLAKHAHYMRIAFPDTGSAITGEAGDNIGRGNRMSICFLDEAAFLERPQLIDASLSQSTNCRQDISTPNGMGNSFAQKRHSGKVPVFTFHWRDDPRKDDAWLEKQRAELDPRTVNQEILISYVSSVDFVLIPADWIESAVDAHIKLGLEPTGIKRGGLDVADQGIDHNALVARHGVVVTYAKAWTGKGSDIYGTVVRAFNIADELGLTGFSYDADGLGAGVRGDARVINEHRQQNGMRAIADEPFQGSGAVWDPEGEMVPERINKNFFANAKAMAWWSLRLRFQNTYRAVVEGKPVDPDSIISLSSSIEDLSTLALELSQPIYGVNTVGKVLIEKQPEGARSPNLADACMIAFNPGGNWAEMWMRLGRE